MVLIHFYQFNKKKISKKERNKGDKMKKGAFKLFANSSMATYSSL